MSSPMLDDDDDDVINASFSSRLSRFKRPSIPTGRGTDKYMHLRLPLLNYAASPMPGRCSNASSDALSDDDFVPVPDESDAEYPATSSRRGSSIAASRSERSSCVDSASDLSGDDAPKKSKKPVRPPLKKDKSGGANTSASGAGGGSNSFLTAAEQRALDKKSEKKSAEDAFEFLKDVRDVSEISVGYI